MRMGSDASNSLFLQLGQTAAQVVSFEDRQVENRAHRTAHGATNERTGRGFAADERLGLKGSAVAHERAHILRARKAVHRDQQAWAHRSGQDLLQRFSRWHYANRE